MSDMVEDVAQEIHRAAGMLGWDRYVSEPVKDEYRKQAEAAINTVLEALIADTAWMSTWPHLLAQQEVPDHTRQTVIDWLESKRGEQSAR